MTENLKNAVTRFAPSPTGYLHVGGARTAVFNWLLAKKTGGTFILRIEDTDQKRNTPTAVQQVIADLKWLGLQWDQGPEVNGPAAPYLQSQRKDLYDKYLDQLIQQGKAYYCFDTQDQLDQLRQQAQKKKQNFLYPRPEKFPTLQDVEQAKAQGKPVTVRFAVPRENDIVVEDIVRGTVTFAPDQVDDFIIQKSDGFPTYHFACVVDDQLMGVTHIIRGQEHLMNTPGHVMLQKALGFNTPLYAHMSVTVSEDGGKLSKRERAKKLKQYIGSSQQLELDQLAAAADITRNELDNFLAGKANLDMPAVEAIAEKIGLALPEINVVDFKRSGYLPETMLNFLALLGWNPGGDQEIMTAQQLIDSFDISRLSKSNSLFDRKKLLAFNTEHIKILPAEKLLAHFKDYLKTVNSPLLDADDNVLQRVLSVSEGSKTLEQIEQKARFLCISGDDIEYDEKAVKKVLKKGGLEILPEIKDGLQKLDPLTAQSIEQMLRDLAEQKQLGLGKVAQPLRVALCGSTISLPIFDAVDLLGLGETVKRIEKTIEKFKD